MSLNDFESLKLLGKGAFASVYQVKRKKDGNIYAMKRVKFAAMSSKEKDNALNEVRILASVTHKNIVGYKESFYDEESKTLNIIMEFANQGDLDSIIKKNSEKKTFIPENQIWSFLIQILGGLRSLHNAKIMHRDLKCANIFLKDGIIKLGDLNVSKIIKRSELDHTQTGTPYYASPEVWSNEPYDYKSDIWSVGCIIYELCALKPPFRGNGLDQLYQAVIKGKYEPIPKAYSQDLGRVIAIMLQVKPSLRPDVAKLMGNPLILTRMDYSDIEAEDKDKLNMLNTIKVPKNLKEINNKLPKQKNYDIGEVILERRSSEERMSNVITNDNNRPVIGDRKNIGGGINNNENKFNDIMDKYRNNNVGGNNNINNNVNRNIGINNNNPHNINNINPHNNKINNNIIGSNNNNPVNKDISKIQNQRAELLNKYNIGRSNNDERIRPKTPDMVPKSNVYEIKRNPNPNSNVNNNNYNNINKVNPGYKPNNYIDNPYIIKK